MVLNITLQLLCQRNASISCSPPMGIHFQNLIAYVEIHILQKEHLGEDARESCLAEPGRGFEDGLLTAH